MDIVDGNVDVFEDFFQLWQQFHLGLVLLDDCGDGFLGFFNKKVHDNLGGCLVRQKGTTSAQEVTNVFPAEFGGVTLASAYRRLAMASVAARLLCVPLSFEEAQRSEPWLRFHTRGHNWLHPTE